MHGSIGVSSNVATSNLVTAIVVSNSTEVEMQQLVVIQVQVIAWKPHSRTSLCWGFFAINDNLPVDLEKP
jgi:hypothetical protein